MRSSVLRSSVFAMSFLSSDTRIRLEARAVFPNGYSRELPFVSPVGTKLTAARFAPRITRSMRAAAEQFDEPLREAEAQGSPFVAFPELSGLALLGLLPRAEQVLDVLRSGLAEERHRADAAREAVQITQGFLTEVFLNTFSVLARGHRMLIAAGGLYLMDSGLLKNRQYLFSETGEVLAYQDKLILSPFERSMGVKTGSTLACPDTRIGRIAMLTASCAQHFEPFAVAAALGARIVTAGASPFGEDLSPLAARGREQSLAVVSPSFAAAPDFGLPQGPAPAVHLPQSGRRGPAASAQGERAATARADLSGPPSFDHYTADRNPAFFESLLDEPVGDLEAVLGEFRRG